LNLKQCWASLSFGEGTRVRLLNKAIQYKSATPMKQNRIYKGGLKKIKLTLNNSPLGELGKYKI
jgi:hypothetical protein